MKCVNGVKKMSNLKTIVIVLKETLPYDYCVAPYENVLELIENGELDRIYTHCLDFFSFDYLDMGYDVVIIKRVNDTMEEKIRLSELLDSEKRKIYTDKEIRKEYNVLKMFKAGAFKLRGE